MNNTRHAGALSTSLQPGLQMPHLLRLSLLPCVPEGPIPFATSTVRGTYDIIRLVLHFPKWFRHHLPTLTATDGNWQVISYQGTDTLPTMIRAREFAVCVRTVFSCETVALPFRMLHSLGICTGGTFINFHTSNVRPLVPDLGSRALN